MAPDLISVTRSRFRSPDGKIRACTTTGGGAATHAIFCKRVKSGGWFLSSRYGSCEAAIAASDKIDGVQDVDYVIVECELV
jgi:hypothetical protein